MSENTWPLTYARYSSMPLDPVLARAIARLRPDNITGALYIAKDYLVMAFAAWACIRISWWLYPAAVLMIGAHQRGLTTISHDAAHRTLARNVFLNYALGILFAAYPLFQKHWAYRVSHVYLHHPYLGNPEKDPDLQFFRNNGVYDVCHPAWYFCRIVVFPICGMATVRYLKFIIANRFLVTSSERLPRTAVLIDGVGFVAFWLLVLGGCYWIGALDKLFLFWVVPYLTTFQVLGWFIELAEHTPLVEHGTLNIHLTRNRRGNLLERILFGVNLDEFHLEHHLSPGVPFWLLRKALAIRLNDRTYAKVAASWGGLFVRGPDGQPSVIGQLMERNDRLYFMSKYRDGPADRSPLPA